MTAAIAVGARASASLSKAVLVDVLRRLPTLRAQQVAGGIVRAVWPGFRHA